MADDSTLRTYDDFSSGVDVGFKYNPWRSPGFAPMLDACGIAGGLEPGASIKGYATGFPGSKLPENPTGTQWVAGSTAEVSFSLFANHG